MPQITITKNIATDSITAFNYILPIDLSHIFKPYSFLPGIKSTTWQSKDTSEQIWKEGISRTVHFDDGSTADEKMTKVIINQTFEYQITNWSSVFKLLVRSIKGKFVFKAVSDKETNIVWTYTLFSQNILAGWLVNLIILPRLQKVLNKAIDIIKLDLENTK